MTTVLIKQYRELDDQTEKNEKLQKEFESRGITALVVPSEVQVEWIEEDNVALIKTYAATKKVTEQAEQLKADFKEVKIDSIILPSNTDIEIAPQCLSDFGINV